VPFAVGEQELAAAAESVGSARAVPRSRAIAAAVAVIAAGALALGLALALRGGEKAALVVPKDAVGLIDPQSNKVIDVIPVGEDPVSVAAGRGAVWVANLNSSTVSRIDPRNHRVTERGIPFHPAALAASRDAVWAGSLTGPEVARIDANGVLPIALRAATANSAENGAGAVAVSSDGVWALVGNFLLEKIDPTTNRVVLSVETTNGPVDVAVGEGAVWTAGAGSVGQHDPKTGTMLQEAPAGGTYLAGIIAVGEGAIWTASGAGGGGTVWKIDPATMQVEDRITVGGNPTSIAVGRGAVWVGDGSSGQVERLDPRSDSVSARIRLGRAPVSSLAVGPQGVWAAVGAASSRFRG
jgi:DNA-binding beta-propeller fold protein YncE